MDDVAPKRPKQRSTLSAAVARSLREGTLWVLTALGLILLLALLSYHPDDPTFADTGGPGPVGNWIGPVGARLAGFFLFLFGRPSYLFPVMLAYAGWLVHKEQPPCDSALEPRSAAQQRGRRAGQLGGRRRWAWSRACPELSRRDPAAAWIVAGRRGAVPGGVLVYGHGPARRAGLEDDRLDPDADRAAPRTGLGPAAQASAAGSRARGTEESRQPAAAEDRGRGPRSREERSRRA